MSITVNLYYTGKDGNARKFAHEGGALPGGRGGTA